LAADGVAKRQSLEMLMVVTVDQVEVAVVKIVVDLQLLLKDKVVQVAQPVVITVRVAAVVVIPMVV